MKYVSLIALVLFSAPVYAQHRGQARCTSQGCSSCAAPVYYQLPGTAVASTQDVPKPQPTCAIQACCNSVCSVQSGEHERRRLFHRGRCR